MYLDKSLEIVEFQGFLYFPYIASKWTFGINPESCGDTQIKLYLKMFF